MRATVMYGAGDVRVENVPDPVLKEPTDAAVRVLRACICGSDLWPYGSLPAADHGRRMGHEFLGVVEDTGGEVSGLARGDWTTDELDRIAATQEVEIAFRRRDGSLATPRIVWTVRAGGRLYVRSVNGRGSAWFRGVQARHEGHLTIGGEADGLDTDIAFVETDLDEATQAAIDAAYRAKYTRYPGPVAHVTAADARAATLEIVPR